MMNWQRENDGEELRIYLKKSRAGETRDSKTNQL